jgi:hypothetical protein
LWQCVDQIRLAGVWDAPHKLREELSPELRNAVAHGVGHVDGARARRDRRLEDAAQEVHVGAHRILGRELDVVGNWRASFTALTAASSTWSGSMRSLCFIWIGLVAMNVCTRPSLRP